jgi:hypothetical protein
MRQIIALLDEETNLRMKNVITGAEMPGAEIFEIQFIDLPKFPKNAGNSMKELWIKFLTAKTEKDLEMLTKENPVMASAVDRLESVHINLDIFPI